VNISPKALQILGRMLEASHEYEEQLEGSLPRVTHEAAVLADNYTQYLHRTDLAEARLTALGHQLQSTSTALQRTRFDLEQQLHDMRYTLQMLQDVVLAAATEAAALEVTVSGTLESYKRDARCGQQQIGNALRSLTLQMRLLANNIEIAAAHAESTATMHIEFFCTLAGLLRSLADQLRSTVDDLRVFEQTQLGHSESFRLLLAHPGVEV
jgi:chromosome segregation ATPase